MSRVTYPELCHGLLSMSRVKIGEICHAHRHGLFWAQNMSRVSGCVTGIFFGFCHGLQKKSHVEKKTLIGS